MNENYYNEVDKKLKQILANEKTRYQGCIYHYTSPEGLNGILENENIRFSNTRFLNDSSENNYIFSLFPKSPNIYDNFLLEENFYKYIRNIADSYLQGDICDIDGICWWSDDVYVASFSKDKDNLELWNYYTKTPNSAGYNIEFQTIPFLINTDNFKFIQGEVIYDKIKQKSFIKEILKEYNKIYVEHKNEIESCSSSKKDFIRHLVNILELHNIFFKHEAYKNEQEYRCAIYNVKEYGCMPYGFNIINGLYALYFSIQFDKNFVKSISVSPSNEQNLLCKGLENYKILKGYPDILINKSNIPKRY